MLGNKQITLRELYDTLRPLVEQYGDFPVVTVKAAEAEKRAVEFEAWRRRVLDTDEEARNLPRNGLTLDPL